MSFKLHWSLQIGEQPEGVSFPVDSCPGYCLFLWDLHFLRWRKVKSMLLFPFPYCTQEIPPPSFPEGAGDLGPVACPMTLHKVLLRKTETWEFSMLQLLGALFLFIFLLEWPMGRGVLCGFEKFIWPALSRLIPAPLYYLHHSLSSLRSCSGLFVAEWGE